MSGSIRVLILEDDEQRITEFRRRFQELERATSARCQVRFVRHVAEAIESLQARSYNAVLLDHDLNGTSGTDRAEADTGSALVRWMASGGVGEPTGRILIHSLNRRGAQHMADLLGAAGIEAECFPRLWKESVFREAFADQLEGEDDSGDGD